MKVKKDCIQIIWKDPRSRNNFVIGEIIKLDKFIFRYTEGVNNALKNGFSLFVPFGDIEEEYVSDNLFQIFASRLPDKKRRDIDQILKKYNLNNYDEFELLKMGAELPIDTLKFVEPIGDIEKGFHKSFFVEGIRHYLSCNGKECDSVDSLREPLKLLPDPQNKYDKYAVKIVNADNDTVGFVPRYYSEKIAESISEGNNFQVGVEKFAQKKDCSACLKISLDLK